MMVRCIHCDYDLAGLVNSTEPVLCPECSKLTDHNNGEPLPLIMPDDRWYIATYAPPAAAGLLLMLGLVINSLIRGARDLDLPFTFAVAGFVTVPVMTLILLCRWNLYRDRRVRGSASKLWATSIAHSTFVLGVLFMVVLGIAAAISVAGY